MNTIICAKCGHDGYILSKANIHLKATCKKCGAFIKFVPQENIMERFPFGQYKNELISKCEDKNYLNWLLTQQNIKISNSLKNAILKQLTTF